MPIKIVTNMYPTHSNKANTAEVRIYCHKNHIYHISEKTDMKST